MTEPDDVAQPFVLIAANPDADMERRLPPVWFGVVRALVAEFLLRDLVKFVSAIGMFGGMWLAAIEWPLGAACMVAGGALGWGAVSGEDAEYERYTPTVRWGIAAATAVTGAILALATAPIQLWTSLLAGGAALATGLAAGKYGWRAWDHWWRTAPERIYRRRWRHH